MVIEKQNNKRIAFIDLAKGVCISLVVIGHCGVFLDFPGLQSMQMPLFFILSGLFFKDYGGIFQLIVNKTNKILIPFLFFYLIGYLVFYFFELVTPGLIKTSAQGILDVFTQRQYFNGPIWFLLCLFWVNLIFCIISLTFKSEWIRFTLIIAIGSAGVVLGQNNVFLPCCIDNSMTALPFFYFGYILHKLPILYPNKYDKYNILIALGLYLLAFGLSILFDNPYIGFHANHIVGNPFIIAIISIASVMAVLLLCKFFNHIPVISFLGRYSIILLCLHHLVYRPILLIFHGVWGKVYWTALLTLLICWALIPLCIKYIPYFVAQKDLIKPKRNFSNSIINITK